MPYSKGNLYSFDLGQKAGEASLFKNHISVDTYTVHSSKERIIPKDQFQPCSTCKGYKPDKIEK